MLRFVSKKLLRRLNLLIALLLMAQSILPPNQASYAQSSPESDDSQLLLPMIAQNSASSSQPTVQDTTTSLTQPLPSVTSVGAFVLSITTNGVNIELAWVTVANTQSYEIHRSLSPFFTPSSATLLQTLPANTTTYTDVGAAGDPAVDHFYIIRSVNGNQTSDSNEVGEVDYPLNNTGEKYSLIALPFPSTTIVNAAALASYIGNVRALLKWNPTTQAFRFFTPPNSGDNFSLTTGDAVFVVVNPSGPTVVTFTGSVTSIQHALTPGAFNFLSLPLQSNTVSNASTLAADLSGVQSLLAWNEATQQFYTFTPPSSGDNFALRVGVPFIAQLTGSAPTIWPATVPTPTPTSTPTDTPTATPTATEAATATPTATPIPTLAPVADTEGPTIEIVAPQDRQAVYTLSPAVEIHYSDNAGVNLATLQVTLNGTNITNNLTANATSATGTLNVSADTSYTLQVTVQDSQGNSRTASSTFYAPPNPASITPPAAPADAGYVSGVVYDASTCSEHLTGCQGLAGVQITLTAIDPVAVQQVRQQRAQQLSAASSLAPLRASETAALATAVNGTVVTGPDGFFAFPVTTTGNYWLKAEKNGYTYGQREIYIIEERSTATNDIYLQPLDSAVTTCGPSGCTHTNSDNSIQIVVPAGAIPAGETRQLSATNFKQVEFLPSGDLPAGTEETYAFNLGGSSEITFTQPVTIRQRNTRGFTAGTRIPLGFWNQALQVWEHAGTGMVDASGQWIEMQVTHFSNYDCNDPVTLGGSKPTTGSKGDAGSQAGGDGEGNPNQCPNGCPCSTTGGCLIHLNSGVVEEEIGLPPVTVLGQDTTPALTYRTTRASPNQVLDIPLTLNPDPGVVFTEHYINFELYIEGEKTDTFTFDATLQVGEVGRYRYLWDGRNAEGQLLPSGVYEYVVKLGIPYRAQYCYALNGIFGNPPDCTNGATGVFRTGIEETYIRGTVKLDAQPDSPYGSGWVIQGQQRLYKDNLGRIMIADGQRVDEFISFSSDLIAPRVVNAQATQYERLQTEALVIRPPDIADLPSSMTTEIFLPIIAAFTDAEMSTDVVPLAADAPQLDLTSNLTAVLPTTSTMEGISSVEPSITVETTPEVIAGQTISTDQLSQASVDTTMAYVEQQAAAQTLVSGVIAANTTWSLANSPYVLNDNVTLAAGFTLTIEAGVEVQFPQPNFTLSAGGTLIANGTAEAPIRFIGTNPTTGFYGGSLSFSGNGNSLLDHVVIDHMGDTSNNGRALQSFTSSLRVSNSVISDSENFGIYLFTTASPTLQNNVIRNNVTGLQVNGGQAQITGNTIANNTIGIIIASLSQATFTGNTIQNNTTGLNITDSSRPVFSNNIFQNNGRSVNANAGGVSGFQANNTLDAIYVNGVVNGAATWPSLGIPYIMNANVTIVSNSSLTIDAGVEVQFPQSSFTFSVIGALVANGTTQAPIWVHGTNLTNGVYGGTFSFAGAGNSTLTHVIFEHMGDSSNGGRVLQIGASSVIVSNSVISDSENVGIYVFNNASPTLQHNVIRNSVIDLQVNGGQAQVINNTIENSTTGILISGLSQATFTGNTIQNNTTGLNITDSSRPILVTNNFQNNGVDVNAHASSVTGFRPDNTLDTILINGTIAGVATWPNLGVPYIVNGNVRLSAGATLTIEPGVEVQFPQVRIFDMNGTFIADGTAAAPIRFRGTNPTAGAYSGSLAFSGNGNSVLDHVIIEHMGEVSDITSNGRALQIATSSLIVSNSVISDSENIGVYVYNQAAPTLRQNVIRRSVTGLQIESNGQTQMMSNTIENNSVGVLISGLSQARLTNNQVQNNTTGVQILSPSQPILAANNFQNNTMAMNINAGSVTGIRADNILNAIHVNGTVSGIATWPNLGVPYIVNGNVRVPTGTTLTIEPGVEVQFPQTPFIDVSGTLVADGTAAAPIRFRGTNQTAGIYGGTITFSGNGNSLLDFVTVEHMGDNGSNGRALQIATSSVIVSNSVISDSEDVGIYIYNGATPTLFSLALLNNRGYGISNQGPQTVNAQAFWWGSASGPYHPTLNPNGTGNRVSDYVEFKPWLTTPSDAVSLTEDDYTTLHYNTADGTYTRVYPTGHQVHFNVDGTHDYTQDSDGHRLRYTYNADGSVASMTFTFVGESSPRYVWTFQYTNGKLTSITDPANQATAFTINGLGQLTQVNFANNTNRRFLYDNHGLLLQRWDEDGNSWRYTYDRFGRINSHSAPPRAVYNYATSTIEVKSETRTFTPSETGYPLINDSIVGDPANPAPAVPKSAALISKVEMGRGTQSGHTNRWGAWTDLTDAIGRTSSFVRDEASRITRRIEPNGDCIEFSYDEQGNPLHSTRMSAAQCALTPAARNPAALQTSTYTYEERFNQLKTATDPLGNTTTYIYDYETGISQAGRLVRVNYPTVQDANGNNVTPSVQYTYNALGLLETMTDEAGIVTRFTYNAAGQLTQLVENQGGLNLTTTFQDFDAAGRPQTVVEPRNNISHFTYDTWGRVLTATDPLGVVTKYEYDGRGNVIRTTLDQTADGVSGRNLITTYGYDGDDRLVSQQTTGDNLTQSTNNVYDINGNLATTTNSEGQTTHFTYDDADQLTSVSNPLNQTTSFAYTTKSELAQITQANGKVMTFGYDAFGNLSSLTPPDQPAHQFSYSLRNEATAYTPPSVGSGSTQTSYVYNALGQLTSFTQPGNRTVTYKYDNAQRIASVTQPRSATTYSYNAATSQLTAIAAPGSINLGYGYDNELLTSVTWSGPLNGSVNYSYDNFYRLTALAVNGADPIAYQYDNNSFVTQAGALTLNRLRQSRLLNSTSLGQVTDAYEYDAFGKLIHYQANANDAAIYDLRYTYDTLNRIATQTETIGGVTTLYAYTYDAVGRLIEVKANGVTVSTYTYDGNGNRLTGPGGATGTYDNQDRLLSYGGNSYTYTANGELLTKTNNGQTTTYDYDVFSNLMAVTLPDGTQIDYLVDGQERRIGKKVNGTLVQGFLYQDQLEPVAELDGNGNVVSRFVYASRNHVPDFMIKSSVTYRIVSDHLGSVQMVINTQTGQISQQMNYDEFGNVTQDTNPGFQPFGFAGGFYDHDTELVRFGARDYEPISGRWTTKDPMRFISGDMNLYRYAWGDPVNLIDINGENPVIIAAAIVLAGAIIGGAIAASREPKPERKVEMGLKGAAVGAGVAVVTVAVVALCVRNPLLCAAAAGHAKSVAEKAIKACKIGAKKATKNAKKAAKDATKATKESTKKLAEKAEQAQEAGEEASKIQKGIDIIKKNNPDKPPGGLDTGGSGEGLGY